MFSTCFQFFIVHLTNGKLGRILEETQDNIIVFLSFNVKKAWKFFELWLKRYIQYKYMISK